MQDAIRRNRSVIWFSILITFGSIIYRIFFDGKTNSILLKHWWYLIPLIVVILIFRNNSIRRIKIDIVILVIFNLLMCLNYVLPKSPLVHELDETYTVKTYTSPIALLSCGTNFYVIKKHWWGDQKRLVISNKDCFIETDLKSCELKDDTMHLHFYRKGVIPENTEKKIALEDLFGQK